MELSELDIVYLKRAADRFEERFDSSSCFSQDTAQMDRDYHKLVEAKDELLSEIRGIIAKYDTNGVIG